jgi:hypothetical protein
MNLQNMITAEIYKQAVKEIDNAHSADIHLEKDNNDEYPSELIYSRRMLTMLNLFYPESDYILKLAVQCQHLKRWNVLRQKYSMNRQGYHQWRREVMEYQLQQTKEILLNVKIDENDLSLILDALKNQGNKSDGNAQIIQDTACLVFVKWYLQAFAAKHEHSKVSDILKKTMRKMSEKAISAIPSIDLSPAVLQILNTAG